MKIKITLLGICLMFFASSSIYAQYDLLDFESAAGGTGLTWTEDANGGAAAPYSNFIANPVSGGINTSGNVASFTALQAGNPWALVFTDIDAFEFDATNNQIKIMVYKTEISDVGIKFEGGTGTPLEVKVPNTLINQWEELTFDFSSKIGSNYNKIVIIPDFQARAQDNIVYFDNVQIPTGNYTPPAGPVGGDITFSVDMNDYITGGGSTAGGVFINGTFNGWCGSCNPMTDANSDGVWDVTLPLGAGAIEYKYTIAGWTTEESLTPGSSCTVTGGPFTNRSLTVNGDQTVATVCWEACVACGIAPPAPPVPATAAPTPIHNEVTDNVISIYSDAYTDVTGTNFNPAWGQATAVTTDMISGNATLKYTGLNYQGTQLGASQNVSALDYIHIDFWTNNSTALNFYLISPGPVEMAYALPITADQWVSVDIPLTSFGAVNLADIIQFKIDGNGTIWFDNFYFHSGTPVPVELNYFKAQAEGKTNVLAWETSTEENNSHFEVQRSTDGKTFEVIGSVEGHGTVYEVIKYEFVDENPTSNAYYRLRQVDFDGQFEYTDVVIVNRGQSTTGDIKLFPNPVQDNLTIGYTATSTDEATITITDVTGRVLITENRTINEGENQLNLDLTDLPQGSYFLRILTETSTTVKAIVKQ